MQNLSLALQEALARLAGVLLASRTRRASIRASCLPFPYIGKLRRTEDSWRLQEYSAKRKHCLLEKNGNPLASGEISRGIIIYRQESQSLGEMAGRHPGSLAIN